MDTYKELIKLQKDMKRKPRDPKEQLDHVMRFCSIMDTWIKEQSKKLKIKKVK